MMPIDGDDPTGRPADDAHLLERVTVALASATMLRDSLLEITTIEPAYGSWWGAKAEEAATLAAALEAARDRIAR